MQPCNPVHPLAARADAAQKRARSAEPTPALERGRGQAVILSKSSEELRRQRDSLSGKSLLGESRAHGAPSRGYVKEAVKEILKAEQEANRRIAAAREEANRSVADTEAKAQALLEERRAQAREEAKRIVEDATKAAEARRTQLLEEAAARANELKESRKERIEAAVEKCVRRILEVEGLG